MNENRKKDIIDFNIFLQTVLLKKLIDEPIEQKKVPNMSIEDIAKVMGQACSSVLLNLVKTCKGNPADQAKAYVECVKVLLAGATDAAAMLVDNKLDTSDHEVSQDDAEAILKKSQLH